MSKSLLVSIIFFAVALIGGLMMVDVRFGPAAGGTLAVICSIATLTEIPSVKNEERNARLASLGLGIITGIVIMVVT